jgi:CHAT domain-containing protein/predicted negative regulator of RcsB-dependent stress response
MSKSGSVGLIARLAAVLAAFGLAVCAAVAAQGQGGTAPRQPTVAEKTTEMHKHPAPAANPEAEFEEAMALRRRLNERDLRSAVRLFADSARRFASKGQLRQAADAKLEAGDVYFMMSSYPQALAAYHQALTLSEGRDDQRCAALSRIARTYANIGQRPHDAQRYADEAVAVCMAISDKKAQADAVEAQGETYFWVGNMTDAVASFTRAREFASEAEDRDGERLAAMMLSAAIYDTDPRRANRLTWSALEGFVASGNEYESARAHLKLAYFAGAEGDLEVARCHCESALPVFQRIGDKDNAAIVLNILGMVARQSGDLDESLSDFRRARNDFASVNDDIGELGSIQEIAEILLSQHKYGDLAPLYARELHLAQSTSNHASLAWAFLNLAGVYARQHQYAQADANYQRSLAEYRVAGNLEGESTALERRAGLQSEQGKYQQALDMLGEAQAIREKSNLIEYVARTQYLRARIYLTLNELEKARFEIEKTIAVIESQRLRIAKFDSRAQYFASVHEYYSLYIQVLMALDRLQPDQKYAQLAFEAAERSKVRSLLDLLGSSQQILPCDRLLAGDLKSADSDPVPDTPPLPDTHPVTLSEIQAEIGDAHTVLLEYALGEDRSFAWVLDGDSLTAFDIGSSAEISNGVRMLRKALLPLEAKADEAPTDYLRRRAAAKSTLTRQSRQLAKLLFGPVHLAPQKRLVIVPDGPLQYLPFADLSVAENGRGAVPLVESHELVMLPSASALVALRRAAVGRPRPADELTVFADPVFEPPGKPIPAAVAGSPGFPRSRELTGALRDLRDSQWIPNLPGSRDEALAIQQIAGPARTRLVMGFDANREAVMDGSIARQRIIHFATHGMMDPRHPEMSGLVLSMFNKRGEYQDGYLRLSDVYNLKLSADLVVLSSCESALGKDLGSEGIMGLPRAFLYAGARSVLVSLWKVDDEATVPLMKMFYSRLQRGEDPGRALRAAQLDMLKNTQWSDPYYWAGFVLEGDYR